MTAWQAHIVGAECTREWSRWCATTRAPGTPAPQYAAIPLEGCGPHTRPRTTMIRGAGPDHPWDAAAAEWLRAAPEPQKGWSGDVSLLIRAPPPPRLVLHAANVLQATEIHTWGVRHGHHLMAPPGGRGHPAHRGAFQREGTYVR